MTMMIGHIFPTKRLSMAMRKADKTAYKENKNYSETELLRFVQDQNVKAWKVMLFIQNFFSWSLFFTSCIVLIKWEITYAKYPERFWYGSNSSLQCVNCKDKICQLKKAVK